MLKQTRDGRAEEEQDEQDEQREGEEETALEKKYQVLTSQLEPPAGTP